ncbi:hypothetical protein MRY87_07200 [bacterium]|nr:hypothetical protein [bacterium]
MEAFWEKILDALVLFLKAFAILLVIRVVFLIFDIPMPIPYVDDIFFYLIDKLGEVLPGLRMSRI